MAAQCAYSELEDVFFFTGRGREKVSESREKVHKYPFLPNLHMSGRAGGREDHPLPQGRSDRNLCYRAIQQFHVGTPRHQCHDQRTKHTS